MWCSGLGWGLVVCGCGFGFDLSVVLIWGFVDSTVFLWLGFVYVWAKCEILGFVSVVWFMPLAEGFGIR